MNDEIQIDTPVSKTAITKLNNQKKVILTLILLVVAGISFFVLASTLSQPSDPADVKGMQKTLTEKSQQILTVWAVVQVLDGLVNVLQNLSPVFQALSPLDNVLDKLSDALLYALGAVLLEKFLLSLSGFLVFKIIIPVCLVVYSITLWINAERMKRIIPVFCLIVIASGSAIPASIQLGLFVEKQFFTYRIGDLVTAITETGKNAEQMETEVNKSSEPAVETETVTEPKTSSGGFLDRLKEGAGSAVSTVSSAVSSVTATVSSAVGSVVSFINNIPTLIATAQKMGEALLENVMNYIIIFVITNIVIPILTIWGIVCMTKYGLKLIAGEPASLGKSRISKTKQMGEEADA